MIAFVLSHLPFLRHQFRSFEGASTVRRIVKALLNLGNIGLLLCNDCSELPERYPGEKPVQEIADFACHKNLEQFD